ncbi:MAG: gamma-glutamyltransferase [Chloroflexi bacterium]|nr:gamma-glutamyltransferase [Chloroflexota bacterium]
MDDGAWRLDDGSRPGPVESLGLNGMVASAHPVAAAIGVSVLQQGGNAIDAAIAVAAAEGVVLPASCGLGGDAFVLVYDPKAGGVTGFNGSGVAGAHASRERYAEAGLTKMPLDGIHSISVPGAVAVYETLWKRYGSRPWADLWQPAVKLAADGVVLNSRVPKWIGGRAGVLGSFKWSAEQYLPGGAPPKPGTKWAAPNLASSLRAVAEGGAETFYRGALAARILAYLDSEGGPFVADDFARQTCEVYTPIQTAYRGVTVCQTNPVSQGFLMLEQLNIVEGLGLDGLGLLSADRLHNLVEAKKLAFDDRNEVAGDPLFVNWDLYRLISKEHAASRRASIDRERAMTPAPSLVGEHNADTSYFCVVDGNGMAVSFIHSLSAAFGSGVVAGDTGITLNNRAGRGFSLQAGHPNVVAPGRRTMHTLNAYLCLKDGKPWLVGGTPGGDQQTQVNTQVLTSIVDQGLTVREALEAPRWFSFPGTDPATIDQNMVIRMESRVPEATRSELEARGHVLEVLSPWGGGGAVQLIELDQASGVLRGASDPRAGGAALGV